MPSRRTAVVVLASILVLVAAWTWMATRMPPTVQETPIVELSRRHLWSPVLGEPSFVWIAIAATALVLIARLVAGRRRVADTLATLTAATFLALGLWLPVASRLWCRAMAAWSEYLDPGFQLAHPGALIAWILVVPLVAATVLTHFEARLSPRMTSIGIAIALLCAIASRHGATVARTRCIGRVPAVDCPSLVYVSFVHVLVAGALVACASILGVAIARAGGTTYACKRYLAFLVIVSVPNLIAIDQSFGLVAELVRR